MGTACLWTLLLRPTGGGGGRDRGRESMDPSLGTMDNKAGTGGAKGCGGARWGKEAVDQRFRMIEEGRTWAVTASGAALPGTWYPWYCFVGGIRSGARGTGNRPLHSPGRDFWETPALGERRSGTGAVPGSAWGTSG